MFRVFLPSRAPGRKGLTSAIAMALALATGAAAGVAGFAEPAMAQPKPKYSKPFVAAYEPVAKAFNEVAEGGDYSPIKAQLPGMVSTVENDDDRYAAGQLILQVGNKSNDQALQRQGLEIMLASGKVGPDQLGLFQAYVGKFAYQAKEYTTARTALEAAIAAGYTEEDLHGMIIESYFQQDDDAAGVAYVEKLVAEREAAGQDLPENWVLRGLQVAYNAKLVQPANELSLVLLEKYPTPKNWLAASQVARELTTLGVEESVDLGRLMMATGAMQNANDLAEYLDAANPRKLSNEVLAALDAAEKAGIIEPGSERFKEAREAAEGRAAADRNEAPGLKGEAQSAATGTVALGVADTFLSFGGYADAEAMYQLAIDKGGIDVNRALTRKGIAQVHQGKFAEAKATFAQVQGVRVQLAKLWSVYADEKAGAGA